MNHALKALGASAATLGLAALFQVESITRITLPLLHTIQGYAPLEHHIAHWSMLVVIVALHFLVIGTALAAWGLNFWRKLVSLTLAELPLRNGSKYSAQKSFAISSLGSVIILVIFALQDRPAWRSLALYGEDGPMETLTVLGSLLGAVFLLAAARRPETSKPLKAGWVLFAVVLLFFAGEEISWGQRIFGITTPPWMQQHNLQNETNLHNLEFFNIVHLYRSCAVLCFGFYLLSFWASLKERPLRKFLPHPSTFVLGDLLAITGVMPRPETFEQAVALLAALMGWRAWSLRAEPPDSPT